MDGEIVEDLDNYCDYIHHSGDVSDTLLRKIAAGGRADGGELGDNRLRLARACGRHRL